MGSDGGRRQAIVAGSFYPADAAGVEQELGRLLVVPERPERAVAAVVPHAGWVYSGGVAGRVWGRLALPPTVVLIGPNHTGLGARAAVWTGGAWQTPLGEVPVDRELADAIVDASPLFSGDPAAHLFEHSLEVQLPFLRRLRPDVRIVPICLAGMSLDDCRALGAALAGAIRRHGHETLLAASTDMNHFEDLETTLTKDKMAIERLLAGDVPGLFSTVRRQSISMCGVVPACVTLAAARDLGARTVEEIGYDTSASASGDTARVVGYFGALIR